MSSNGTYDPIAADIARARRDCLTRMEPFVRIEAQRQAMLPATGTITIAADGEVRFEPVSIEPSREFREARDLIIADVIASLCVPATTLQLPARKRLTWDGAGQSDVSEAEERA